MTPDQKIAADHLTALLKQIEAQETPEERAEREKFLANELTRPIIEVCTENLEIVYGWQPDIAEQFTTRMFGIFKSTKAREPQDYLEFEEWLSALDPKNKFLARL